MTTPHRFRFGLHTLFLVVVLMTVAAGAARDYWSHRSLMQRKAYDMERKAHYLKKALSYYSSEHCWMGGPVSEAYRRAMYEKYMRAAERPWLPVEPDPPIGPMPREVVLAQEKENLRLQREWKEWQEQSAKLAPPHSPEVSTQQ